VKLYDAEWVLVIAGPYLDNLGRATLYVGGLSKPAAEKLRLVPNDKALDITFMTTTTST
jgi:hypothetical protein